MEELREIIKEYSDDYLFEQFTNHQNEYTPEALEMIKEEMKLRNINLEEKKKPNSPVKHKIFNLDSDDFFQFDDTFSRTDLIIAISILKDNDIIFFSDNPSSVDSYPIESEAQKRYKIYVHKDFIEKTDELLSEHFENKDGIYLSKYFKPLDRLKSFNFHDIRISDKEAKELIDVGFSEDEVQVICNYGNRLISEIDTIERQRVIFFYDSVEPLIDKLKNNSATRLNRPDLLAILEILQIFCDYPDFPTSMDETIMTLLNFFLE